MVNQGIKVGFFHAPMPVAYSMSKTVPMATNRVGILDHVRAARVVRGTANSMAGRRNAVTHV